MRKMIPVLIFLLPFQSLFINFYLFSLVMALIPFLLILGFSNNRTKKLASFFLDSRPLFPFIAFFYISILISYIFSNRLSMNDLQWLALTISSIGFMILTTIYIRNTKDAIYLLKLLFFTASLQFIIYILYKYDIWGSGLHSEYGVSSESRYQGTFGGYELLAEYLGLNFVVSLGLIVYNKMINKSNISIYFCTILILFTGVLTATRGFIVAVLSPPIIFALINMRYSSKKRIIVKLLLLFIIISSILYSFLIPQKVIDYNIIRVTELDFVGERAFNRNYLYVTSLQLVSGMPITGYGTQMLETFNSLAGENFVSPHSLYMYILLMTGFLGFFSLILLVGKILYWSYKNIVRRSKSDIYKGIDIALFVFWLFWAFSETKIDAIRQHTYMSLIMVYLGITNAMIRRRNDTR